MPTNAGGRTRCRGGKISYRANTAGLMGGADIQVSKITKINL